MLQLSFLIQRSQNTIVSAKKRNFVSNKSSRYTNGYFLFANQLVTTRDGKVEHLLVTPTFSYFQQNWKKGNVLVQ